MFFRFFTDIQNDLNKLILCKLRRRADYTFGHAFA